MDIKCSYISCKKPASFICHCSDVSIVACSKHFKAHINSSPELIHNPESVFKPLSPILKTETTKALQKTLQNFTESVSTIKETLQCLNRAGDFLVKSLNKRKKICKKYIQGLVESNEFPIASTERYRLSDEVTLKDIEKEMKNVISGLEIEDLKFEAYKLINVLDSLNLTERIESDIEDDRDKWPYLDNKLYFFEDNTKSLVEFNPVSCKSKIKPIEIGEDQGHLAAICEIPGGKVFTSGGFSDTYRENSYIIDLKTNTSEVLPRIRPRMRACATYLNQSIYLFGGWFNNSTCFCDRIDLNNKIVVSISNLPSNIGNTSAVAINDKILISGTSNFLQLYNTKDDNYSIVSRGLTFGTDNLLIQDKNRVILLSKPNIFVCDMNNLENWINISSGASFESTTSKPVIRGRMAYFVDMSMNIYQFNLDTFVLKKMPRFNS
ncbi:hypothetical protein SteCoe_26773 [Stentor coeruleus]|uniref:Uncharacterized protein n=1 Tax=Stentor coeruleus TaxID=5963 RepID=A0A1R2BCH0_9CILI|nr:hypothetical protein SteCoe_26773 [Stentor coeruleus]